VITTAWSLHALSILLSSLTFTSSSSSTHIRSHLLLLQSAVDLLEENLNRGGFGFGGGGGGEIGRCTLDVMNVLLPLFFEIDPTHPCIQRLAMIARAMQPRVRFNPGGERAKRAVDRGSHN